MNKDWKLDKRTGRPITYLHIGYIFPAKYHMTIELKPKGWFNKLFNISKKEILCGPDTWENINEWYKKWYNEEVK